MNRFSLCLILALACLGLQATNWQTMTNTSHVYDLMWQEGTGFLFSTWGGVVQIGPTNNNTASWSQWEEKQVWTTADGLASNDIRNLEYISLSESYWFGSAVNGISIVSPQGVQQLNSDLGLPSNNVAKIVEHGSNILVATAAGLASYYYLEGVNFPLLLHQYNTQTTPGLLSNSIDAMVLAENNYLYLSSTAGINFVHLDSLDVDSAWHHFSSGPVTPGFENKLATAGGKLLVATYNAVFAHSSDPWSGGWQSYTPASHLTGEAISSVSYNAEFDNIWVSYGLWDEDILYYSNPTDTLLTVIYSTGEFKHWQKFESGLGDKCVSKVISLGTFEYLCTWGDGVFQSPPVWAGNRGSGSFDYWTRFQPNSLGFPKVRNIATDANHAAWFASGALSPVPTRKSSLGASRYLDGQWQTFTVANSPLQSDNIFTVAVDSQDRKWFGTYDVNSLSPEVWDFGLTVWDEATDTWRWLTNAGLSTWNPETQIWPAYDPSLGRLMGNTAVHMSLDTHGNMLVACYDDGFTVLDPSFQVVGQFTIPNSVDQRSIYSYHSGSQYFFGTYNDRGLVIWNHDSLPVTDGAHWLIPEPAELRNCEVYGVVTIESPYEGTQHWIAVSNGLFMWDEQDWYKWDTSIKRYKYNRSTGTWQNDQLYYVDEERLYGSVRTTPTAIFRDPFNRVWIGSLEHGISRWDPETERFTNYFKDNSPLLSDYITALGYQPTEGLLLIGTPDGLNTLSIGRTIKPETSLQTLELYPNPFRPGLHASVLISNFPTGIMPRGTNRCKIFDSSGALVIELEENEFSRFEWDGLNASGQKCASGIYFVVVNDSNGKRLAGKIALLR